jgi:glycerophosphoryl diester phosphodiesterase
MWILYLSVAGVACMLLLLAAIAPRRKRNTSPFDHTLYAHRGLHDNATNAPENSLAAFAAAAAAGYGVELDVQFTADRQIVVFHDSDLKRMCGINKRVDELTYAELCNYTLLDSDQTIPLLSDVLEVLGGATLLCEFKAMRSYIDTSLCEAALPLLNNYKGAVCIESFNPFMVRWFKKHAPQYIRGILSKRFVKGEVAYVLRFPLASLFTNWLCRPDFVAYQHTDYKQPFFRLCRLFRPTTIAWTVGTADEYTSAKQHFDAVIFEGFSPAETN